ncbi:methylated-DNA--[protein]-cysteine S-methyltransferase [Reinekea marinisedimentorum]|uniref:Methylated-DNA--protein-cysteine methyltransferase n=1 Tax=Reinekea marinisedimentorum TaxID=230495 RepID=A0A4R3IC08_9GAMM|nr:methylated-DNA--[protein]-cysteine S-methyltransferase [Reinekea marinisedimentorum]TCS43675.1 methylated-DNA-[protein]-cysteine S-methyltransferase [Reinekea marinisedimentorum]
MKYTTCPSPLGIITLQANRHSLTGAWFETQTTQPANLGNEDSTDPVLQLAVTELKQYFAGTLTRFTVPCAPSGTAFQQSVWQALRQIPFGETRSYQQLAEAIGNTKAVRAVGLANGKNPVSIIVPCHRVIGKSGKLTGYAGGVERKAWLLNHESS